MSCNPPAQPPLETYTIEGGITILELVKHVAFESNSCDVDLMELPPKTSMRLHFHRTFNEVFVVTSGSGFVRTKDTALSISAGDVFTAKMGEAHAVTTGSEALSVVTLCLPRFDKSDIVYTES